MTIAIAHRDTNGRLTFTAPPKKRGFWTEVLDTRLRLLAPDHSASQIATMIGASRNAVIGRCHRAGINLKKTATVDKPRSLPRPRVAAPPAPKRPKAFAAFGGETDPAKVDQIAAARAVERDARIAAASADWTPARVPFMAIRDGLCRWPLWTGSTPFAGKFFCGNESLPGLPYCQHCRTRGTAPRATVSLDRKLGVDKARAAA